MTTTAPLHPDLTRDLPVRAKQAKAHCARRARNELSAVQLSHGRHADHGNVRVLRRILTDHDWPGHLLVDPGACRTACQIALHADEHDFQRMATRLLHPAVQAGSVEALALTVARRQHEAFLQILFGDEFTRAGVNHLGADPSCSVSLSTLLHGPRPTPHPRPAPTALIPCLHEGGQRASSPHA